MSTDFILEQLVNMGALPVDEARRMTHVELGVFMRTTDVVPSVRLEGLSVARDVLRLLDGAFARSHVCLPLFLCGSTLLIAMDDPSDVFAIDDLRFLTAFHVAPLSVDSSELAAAIEAYYPDETPLEELEALMDDPTLEFIDEPEGLDLEVEPEGPIITLTRVILLEAERDGATRITCEVRHGDGPRSFVVRHTVDGVEREVLSPPLELWSVMFRRFCHMAGILFEDATEGVIRVRAEDGRELVFGLEVIEETPSSTVWTIDVPSR